jgi:ribosome-associated protein
MVGAVPEELWVSPGTTVGQALKIAGVASTGGQAKALILGELVDVNGSPELQRGRKLADGDRIECQGHVLLVRLHSS